MHIRAGRVNPHNGRRVEAWKRPAPVPETTIYSFLQFKMQYKSIRSSPNIHNGLELSFHGWFCAVDLKSKVRLVEAIYRASRTEPGRPGSWSLSFGLFFPMLRSLSVVQYAMANMADIKNSLTPNSIVAAQPPFVEQPFPQGPERLRVRGGGGRGRPLH